MVRAWLALRQACWRWRAPGSPEHWVSARAWPREVDSTWRRSLAEVEMPLHEWQALSKHLRIQGSPSSYATRISCSPPCRQ